MKFVTVRIHFLSDAFGLLSSRNFATMATWRNDFSLWINVMKAIETEYDCVFWKLVSLTVFQSSFLWVFITFDLMFGKRICLTPSSGFHKWFLLFQITTILLKSKEIRQTYTTKIKTRDWYLKNELENQDTVTLRLIWKKKRFLARWFCIILREWG